MTSPAPVLDSGGWPVQNFEVAQAETWHFAVIWEAGEPPAPVGFDGAFAVCDWRVADRLRLRMKSSNKGATFYSTRTGVVAEEFNYATDACGISFTPSEPGQIRLDLPDEATKLLVDPLITGYYTQDLFVEFASGERVRVFEGRAYVRRSNSRG